jgi:hypothetical protein
MNEEILNLRQGLVDNYDSLLKSLPSNKAQVSLFEDEPSFEYELTPKTYMTNVEMLEREREVLSLVASVEYVKHNTMFAELLNIPRISETDRMADKVKAVAVCVAKGTEEGKWGPVYTASFADSFLRIEIEVDLTSQNNFRIGDLYLINYTQFNTSKPYAKYKLLRAFKASRLYNHRLFTKGKLIATSAPNYDKLNKGNEFVSYIKSIESDVGGIKIEFKHNEKILKTKVLLDDEIYDHLTNYFNIKIIYGRN